MEKTTNKVELNGYVGQEARTVTTGNGKNFTTFSLATSESHKNTNGEWINDTTWHSVMYWNGKNMPEGEEIKKGQRIAVSGKLRNRQYTDKNGVVRYVTEIVAQSVELLQVA